MPDDLALAAEAIVRALAATMLTGEPGCDVCLFCGKTGEWREADDCEFFLVLHRPDCWIVQARRWVVARDATPEAAAPPSLARALNMARPHPEAVRE